MDSPDHNLLERYLNAADHGAFTELVRRHLPPVHSAALRVSGNPAAAAEISQIVFSRLAGLRAAPPAHLPLIVWLHRTARSVSIDLLRSETRRRHREEIFASLHAAGADPFPWEELAPVLDEVIDRLSAGDRALILRRFFAGESHAAIAETLGLSEDAARMRINRALEKMKRLLDKRGITTTACALALGLPAHGVTPLSAGFVTSVSAAALSAASFAAPVAITFSSFLPATLMTSKSAAVAVVLLLTGAAVLLLRVNAPERREDHTIQTRAVPMDGKATFSNPGGVSAGAGGRTAPFKAGGARVWIQGLSGLRYLQSKTGEDALVEALSSLDAKGFQELEGAVLEELKDASRLSSRRKFAIRLLMLAWPRWIEKDPDGALASMNLGAQIDPDYLDDDTVETVFRRFASRNPEAAEAAADRLPEFRRADAKRGIVMAAALQGSVEALGTAARLGVSVEPALFVDDAAERYPARTAELAAALSGDDTHNNALLRAMEKWSEADSAAAEAWMRAYRGPGRTTGMTALLGRQVWTDPQGAAEEFLKLEDTAGNPHTPRLAGRISEGLFKQSGPGEALAWAEKLPPNPRAAAVSETLKHWAKEDAESASGWLGDLPAGPVRDAGAVSLIESIHESSPAEAWEWARSISALEKRAECLNKVREAWQKTDAGAAQTAWEALESEQQGEPGR